jgi:hypothetical protein
MYLLSLSGTIINSRSHPLKTHTNTTPPKKKVPRKKQEKVRKRKNLINTKTHWRTPATPVQEEGPFSVRASCTSSPTAPARDTNDTTYDTNSHNLSLHRFQIIHGEKENMLYLV